MPNIRMLLWFALIGSLWVSYTTWVNDHPAPEPTAPPPVAADGSTPDGGFESDVPTIPDAATQAPQLPDVEAAPTSAPDVVHVRTDVLDMDISLQGGDLVRADLLRYPVAKNDPDTVVRLLDYAPATYWVYQTGLRGTAEGPEPNHLAPFRADQREYTLAPGQDELTVTLTWNEAGPLAVTKTYTFRPGQYEITLDIAATNTGATPWDGVAYTQMVRLHNPPERSYFSVDARSYTGPVWYDGEEYSKLKFEDLLTTPEKHMDRDGWYAAIEHHFLAAAVPPLEDDTTFEASASGRQFRLRAISPAIEVSPGSSYDYTTRLFVGPKLQSQLDAVGDKLKLTVDYGLLTPLSGPLFWLLSRIHDLVNNWGIAIVLVTLLIKLAFYKLTATSGRSMAKMRKLAPRMKALQERYKDDRTALSQSMMELYKREKVNPAAGCLPMLIQMPFFFAFYWVLIESVEMRQAPFMLWINDLSSRDPYFVLPLLMGAAMLFQTRLNPAPPDPMQARIMQVMPIVFTAMFAFFPAGLVLYWLTNTVSSIAQQWRINKLVAREG